MKALIIDDDRILADVVAFALRREGFQVIQAHDGSTGLRRWKEEEPDLIVLDVNLPNKDGFTVCKEIRTQADTPIIMLTVRGEDNDIVKGLEFGADDYISKPFSPRQLVARAHAVLRRAGVAALNVPRQVGVLIFDPNRREASIGDSKPISLTPLEGRLLSYLMSNPGQVLTTDSIIDRVWGPRGGDRDMLRQLVRRLRSKIEPEPTHPTYIINVPGLGYGLIINRKDT